MATANFPSYEKKWVNHIWLPIQQMDLFAEDPMVVVGAKGMRVITEDGKEYIDAIGGAMVSGLGYGNEAVKQAMHQSIGRLDYWPVLHATTPPAVKLAKKLADLLPGDLNSSFFVSSGSEATETAIKMARHYHQNLGHSSRYKVISRYWSYHGATFGAMAASGVSDKRKSEPLPTGFKHALPPYCYRCPWNRSPDTCSVECASAVEDIIAYEGKHTVSCLIVDPIMAAAGILKPPNKYYQKLREVCNNTGVLLIFDEVLTGFGRTGPLFACEMYNVLPDIICLGKGITSGYAPLSATVARDAIAKAFQGDPSRIFIHIHTYGGHPLGCDTALAVIDQLTRPGLLENAEKNARYFQRQLKMLADSFPYIGDIRGSGMLWGVEFVLDKKTKQRFPRGQSYAESVRRQAKKLGLLTRGSSDVLMLAPTLTASKSDLDEIISVLGQALERVNFKLKAGTIE